ARRLRRHQPLESPSNTVASPIAVFARKQRMCNFSKRCECRKFDGVFAEKTFKWPTSFGETYVGCEGGIVIGIAVTDEHSGEAGCARCRYDSGFVGPVGNVVATMKDPTVLMSFNGVGNHRDIANAIACQG